MRDLRQELLAAVEDMTESAEVAKAFDARFHRELPERMRVLVYDSFVTWYDGKRSTSRRFWLLTAQASQRVAELRAEIKGT